MNPYENLANAIIIQAAKDYSKALRRLRKCSRDRTAGCIKQDCERFFRSGWFQTLTSLDGDLLMEKIQKEVYSV